MKILIVKTSSLGDIVQSFPVLDYLKACYPNSQIDWVVEKPFSELLTHHPKINQIFLVNTREWRKSFWKKETREEILFFIKMLRNSQYDLILDLQGNTKSGCITAAAKSLKKVGFGYATVAEWPNLLTTHMKVSPPICDNIRDQYLFLAQKAVGESQKSEEALLLNITEKQNSQVTEILMHPVLSSGTKILVCPGSQWVNKKLSFETWYGFLKLIGNNLNASFLFLWGTQEEKKEAEILHTSFSQNSLVCDRLSLSALQHLISCLDLVIAMDSLPLHLAGTTSTPTFSVFGPSLASKYKPTGSSHYAFQAACPYGKKFKKRCPLLRTCPTGSCMKGLTATALFTEFMSWMETRACR